MKKKGMALAVALLMLAQGCAVQASAQNERLMQSIRGARPEEMGSFVFGCRTMADGGQRLNEEVVRSLYVCDDGQGNQLCLIELMEDLTYSDGTPITAADYVFSVMLGCAPGLEELNLGAAENQERYVGEMEYREGKPFAGVRLLSDNMFLLSIPKARVSEGDWTLLDVTPFPVGEIAPGCLVRDDGHGAYLLQTLTSTLLEKALLDESSGYLFNPGVSSGEYRVVAYNAATGDIRLERNPYYKASANNLVELADLPIPLSSGQEETEGQAKAQPTQTDAPKPEATPESAPETGKTKDDDTHPPAETPTGAPLQHRAEAGEGGRLKVQGEEALAEEATEEPTAAPEATPAPETPKVLVASDIKTEGGVRLLVLTAKLVGFGNAPLSVQWQCDQGKGWYGIENATQLELRVGITETNMDYQWRVRVEVED